MSTKTLASSLLRFSKVFAALTLSLAMGLHTASAISLPVTPAKALTSQEASAYAKLISASKNYNQAYATALQLTANTGAQYAVFNVRMIAGRLDGDIISLTALINALSFNYPGQQANIIAQAILLNEQNRENAVKILALVGSGLSSDAAAQLAVVLNQRLLKDSGARKKACIIAYTLLSAIQNSATGTPEDRAREMATVAANLAAHLLTPNKHGTVTSSNLKAFSQIALVLASFANTADTGSLTREQFINNIVGYFATTIQSSATSGAVPQAQIINTLNRTRAILIAALPQYSSIINSVVQDVINTGGFGPIVPPETPH